MTIKELDFVDSVYIHSVTTSTCLVTSAGIFIGGEENLTLCYKKLFQIIDEKLVTLYYYHSPQIQIASSLLTVQNIIRNREERLIFLYEEKNGEFEDRFFLNFFSSLKQTISTISGYDYVRLYPNL